MLKDCCSALALLTNQAIRGEERPCTIHAHCQQSDGYNTCANLTVFKSCIARLQLCRRIVYIAICSLSGSTIIHVQSLSKRLSFCKFAYLVETCLSNTNVCMYVFAKHVNAKFVFDKHVSAKYAFVDQEKCKTALVLQF